MRDKLQERQLILLRGMPGAGKSTFAQYLSKEVNSFRHVEGDQWRGFGDLREYSREYNDNAHMYAIGYTAHLLRFTTLNVVVSNTFPTLKHLKPFFDLAHELNNRSVEKYNIKVTVLHVQGPLGRSVQSPLGVGCNHPDDIQAYLDIWEDYQGEFDAAV
ncbi:ATPase [Agrobacterium phage Alfirin]|nr:ATPase [Agrobacterium phage Alfirin]